MIWLLSIVIILMLGAALATLLVPNAIGAIAAFSVVSLGLSLLFALLRAPDVALTEAAVGAGLGSLILALSLRSLNLAHLKGTRNPAQEERDA